LRWSSGVSCRIDGGVVHLCLDLGFRRLGHAQAEAHIVGHRHMWVERVGLEDHGDAAFGGLALVHACAADIQVAAGDFLEAGDHPEQGGLAAAGRADEDGEFTLFDRHRHAMDDLDGPVGLGNIFHFNLRHVNIPQPLTAPVAMPLTMRRWKMM
jgi:hypothetical protein